MTLLESLVALVILGLTAVGFLDAFQTDTRAARDAELWAQAVGYAEAVMEETKLGALAGDPAALGPLPTGFAPAIAVEPWPGAPGVEEVTVTITFPDGGSFVLRRLARTR